MFSMEETAREQEQQPPRQPPQTQREHSLDSGIDYVALAMEDIGRWDSRLVELVRENKIDPWDVDIVLLTAKYLQKIEELSRIDFRIPGKAVLTAATLLRLKSDRIFESVKVIAEVDASAGDGVDYSGIEIPQLRPIRRVVERKITLTELVEALKETFDVERNKLYRRRRITQFRTKRGAFAMEELMDRLQIVLSRMFGERNEVLLTDLLEYDEAFAHLFLGLLHLAGSGFIELKQESWNGDIWVVRTEVKDVPIEARGQEVTQSV